MFNLSNRYGVRRVAEIAAKVEAARAAMPLPVAIEVPAAPVLSLVPALPSKAARVAAQQAERATLRADLPMLRAAALEAMYHSDGPTFAEVEAAESRLADLDDYLIFEPDFAEIEMARAARLAKVPRIERNRDSGHFPTLRATSAHPTPKRR